MELNIFKNILAITADSLTIIAIILIPIYGYFMKKRNVIGFKINTAMQYMPKIAVIIIVGVCIFYIWFLLFKFGKILLNAQSDYFFWEEGKGIQYVIFYSISILLALPLFWFLSKIIWKYTYKKNIEGNISITSIKEEKSPDLKIEEAIYGTNVSEPNNVTRHVRKMIKDGTLKVQFTNELAGDPARNIEKEGIIKYRFGDGPIEEREFKEFDTVEILGPKNIKIIPGKYSLRDNKEKAIQK